MTRTGRPEGADTLVVFGITGDLARKMTLRALYRLEARGLLDCRVIGVAADDLTTADFVAQARERVAATGQRVDDDTFRRFAARVTYLHGDVTDAALYTRLSAEIGPGHRTLHYLEMPPRLFGPIVERLGAAGLVEHARVAVEKPFGKDLASARALNARLHAVLREDQLLRVDHFLGKEPVIELEYLRFANRALAGLWDRDSVSAVQITMAEDFGIEGRGSFYDPVGALRDVVQNHLLQVLAAVTMDPPADAGADSLRDRKAEVLKAVRAADPRRSVRGQYTGYRDTPGVAAGSDTETYIALRLEIDNWKWIDVPFFLRAGKNLPVRDTEVRLILRRAPRLAFLPTPHQAEPNQIVLRIDPDPGVCLQLVAQGEQTWRPLHLDASFVRDLGEPPEPYERLLHGALTGDHSLFTREDGVEEAWRIVQPLLDDPAPLLPYAPGTWGPAEAADLVTGHPPWHDPWTAGSGAPAG
ncbi:putative glucose-6-phosphate 1-dehydrogenase [Actinacidiphila reveromycinica]|uniref:Glucose-6-phosphate 1-dehydrogenase n=1 Tax=Actinacidiphila reveromycinica TaxID=659352 RepID=A0A7U3V0G0_9ACTN|nr:glucose-6-phosphate dehydrogenase [Streptomyces sp. SN-593]BBB02204.1 putative glucose-6-phosphate 1-dehydrogenase [Streptomyces sp. SN-593]